MNQGIKQRSEAQSKAAEIKHYLIIFLEPTIPVFSVNLIRSISLPTL